jgi:hypothetical protein
MIELFYALQRSRGHKEHLKRSRCAPGKKGEREGRRALAGGDGGQ